MLVHLLMAMWKAEDTCCLRIWPSRPAPPRRSSVLIERLRTFDKSLVSFTRASNSCSTRAAVCSSVLFSERACRSPIRLTFPLNCLIESWSWEIYRGMSAEARSLLTWKTNLLIECGHVIAAGSCVWLHAGCEVGP